MAEDAISPLRTWLAVFVLGIASFTMVTTEFAPIGLLSQIAANLERDPAEIGLTVTLYAWIGAGTGILSAILPRGIPRKALLIFLMLILSVSNFAAMNSHSFEGFLIARSVGAVVHGLFWAMAAAVATQIAPSHRMGVATAIVFGGISMATVFGVPVVNLIGHANGWHASFALIGAVGLVSSAVMAVVLPKLSAGPQAGWSGLGSIMRRRDLLVIYAITAFMATANFAAYTFIEPFLAEIPNLPHATIPKLLLGFGAAGFLGNVLSGMLMDRFMKSILTTGLFALCLALMFLGCFGPKLGAGWILASLIIWGAAIAILFAGLQTWVLRVAGSIVVPAAAMHSTVINAAIGFGAILGAYILPIFGVSGIMCVAGVVVIVPLFTILLVTSPAEPSAKGNVSMG